jgi:hypothetical protein
MTTTGRPAAAWYPDPSGRHQHRYWDGERWTLHVADDGVTDIEGHAPQPVVQQPVVPQPVVQQPVVPQAQPVTQWTPTPTPAPAYGASPVPVASSKARGVVVVIAVVVAIAGIGLTAMLALGRSSDDGGTSAAAGGQRYPETVEANFMSGCTGGGGTPDYCRCALDHLEQDYDLREFAEAERSYTATGQLPDSMVGAVRECLPKLFQQ